MPYHANIKCKECGRKNTIKIGDIRKHWDKGIPIKCKKEKCGRKFSKQEIKQAWSEILANSF